MEMKQNSIFKKLLPVVIALAALGIALLVYLFRFIVGHDLLISPLGSSRTASFSKILVKPLEKYTVLNLEKYPAKPAEIVKEKVLLDDPQYTSYLISFQSDNKKVSGMLNVPIGSPPVGGFPVIVMFRGYVDPTIYQTGVGTQRAAEFFAKNGLITFAPDFFGYGESAKQSEDIMEERFQTYTVVLDTLSTVVNIEKADPTKIGVWGHSNGGQIALTILEATQKEYPTTLWAPVSKPFPFSVLYYTDESQDRGKFLRREIADFEKDYDADLYSITDYFDRIKAPIQLHQGNADDAVPQKWSDELAKILEKAKVKVTYFTYPGADHNLIPAWNTVVERDLQFFQKNLQ